jgi:hypothetical protein
MLERIAEVIKAIGYNEAHLWATMVTSEDHNIMNCHILVEVEGASEYSATSDLNREWDICAPPSDFGIA